MGRDKVGHFPFKNDAVTTILKSRAQHHVVYPTILHAIGNTPLVKLNRVPKDHGLECDIFVKCEYLNPGDSIKDRVAHGMVLDVQSAGETTARTRFVEPTSGNTGIGIALSAVVEGYKCTVVTSDKNSEEKYNTLKLLGAEVVLVSATVPYTDPNSEMGVTQRIVDSDPDAICLNQFRNDVNPVVHYETTAEEILAALNDQVDMVVAGVGTGGTVTGLGYRLKQRCPTCVVVAVDPKGSVIFGKGPLTPFLVEGIGGDYVPDVLDKSIVDMVEAPDDKQAFLMAREVIRKEGILCGGSSGAALWSAVQAAKALRLGAGSRVVVVLPDGIRNYMSKFVTDQWMEAQLFMPPPKRDYLKWWKLPLKKVPFDRSVPRLNLESSIKQALEALGEDHSVALVIETDGSYKGAISKNSIRNAITNPPGDKSLDLNDPVKLHLNKNSYSLSLDAKPTVGLASRVLDITPFVVVLDKSEEDKKHGSVVNLVTRRLSIVPKKLKTDGDKYEPKGIITPTILLDFILKHN